MVQHNGYYTEITGKSLDENSWLVSLTELTKSVDDKDYKYYIRYVCSNGFIVYMTQDGNISLTSDVN